MSIGGIDDTIDRTDKHMDDRPTGRRGRTIDVREL